MYYFIYMGWDWCSVQLCFVMLIDLWIWIKYGLLFDDFDIFKIMDFCGFNWLKVGVIVFWWMYGKWWMYFGEGVIYWVISDDLIYWMLGMVDIDLMYFLILGIWDEVFVEIGMFFVFVDNGLLVFFINGVMCVVYEDGMVDVDYWCGQIVIDLDELMKVIVWLQELWL